jgi:hypothetical protein
MKIQLNAAKRLTASDKESKVADAQKKLDKALKEAQGYKDNDRQPPGPLERKIKEAREALKEAKKAK